MIEETEELEVANVERCYREAIAAAAAAKQRLLDWLTDGERRRKRRLAIREEARD